MMGEEKRADEDWLGSGGGGGGVSPRPYNAQQPNGGGYPSPTMSSNSYDPYSPNSKIGKCSIIFLLAI